MLPVCDKLGDCVPYETFWTGAGDIEGPAGKLLLRRRLDRELLTSGERSANGLNGSDDGENVEDVLFDERLRPLL